MNIPGIEDEIFKYNNSPLEKLSGLSPTAIALFILGFFLFSALVGF